MLKQKFLKYFIKDKKSFLQYFFLSFIVGLLELFGVALTYPFIIRLLSKDGLDKASLFFGGLIIAAFLAKNLFMIFYNSLQVNFTRDCESNIRKEFMKYFLSGDYSTVAKISFAQKNQILNFLIPSSINNYLVRILNICVNIFIFSLIISFLFVKFFMATVITLFCSLALLSLEYIFFKTKTKAITKIINKASEELNQANSEPLLSIKTVKILNGEEYFFNKYSHKLDSYTKISKKIQ